MMVMGYAQLHTLSTDNRTAYKFDAQTGSTKKVQNSNKFDDKTSKKK